jgi:hypothetical protein
LSVVTHTATDKQRLRLIRNVYSTGTDDKFQKPNGSRPAELVGKYFEDGVVYSLCYVRPRYNCVLNN